MKKPFSLRNNPRPLLSQRSLPAITALIAIVVVVLLLRVFVPSFLVTLASPFWGFGTTTSDALHTSFSYFSDRAELTRERDTLVSQNEGLQAANQQLLAQVQDLKKLAGSRTGTEKGILAGVLVRAPIAAYDTLIVDRGSTDGVAVNSLVLGDGGVPLGMVDSVTAHTADISLFSERGRTTDGWVGDARIPLTLTGQGAGAFSATLPRGSGIVVGNIVYLPGPGALPVGTVVKIDTDPSSPNDTIHIQPYLNPFSITWVTIEPHS